MLSMNLPTFSIPVPLEVNRLQCPNNKDELIEIKANAENGKSTVIMYFYCKNGEQSESSFEQLHLDKERKLIPEDEWSNFVCNLPNMFKKYAE